MVAAFDGSTRVPSRAIKPVLVLAFTLMLGDASIARANAAPEQPGQRVILGTIVDAQDRPIPFVAVTVSGARASSANGATADDSGRFRLILPNHERVVFDARRVGFMPSRFSLVAGGDTSVTILLLPSAANLPALEVKDAATRPAGLEGFERRMTERKRGAGAGWFIEAKDIEAASPIRATQVVETVPSIYVRRVNTDRFAIYGRSGLGEECPATVYLDGVVVGGISDMVTGRDRRGRTVITKDGEGAPIDMVIEPSQIAGVEVYQRGIFAPIQLQPNDPNAMRCAIVAYWSKHANSRTTSPRSPR
jgi:hypothetical protein